MSLGDPLFEGAYARDRLVRLVAEADAARAARQAGRKTFLSCLRARLRRRGTRTAGYPTGARPSGGRGEREDGY